MSNTRRLRTVGAGGLQRLAVSNGAAARRRVAAARQARRQRRNTAFSALALATGQRQGVQLPTAGTMPRRSGPSTSGSK